MKAGYRWGTSVTWKEILSDRVSLIYCIIGGILFFSVLAVTFGSFLGDNMTRIIAPGESLVEFREDGDYIIYYEYVSSLDDRHFSTGESYPGLEIEIKNKTTNFRVKTSPSSSAEYEIFGRKGRSILAFEIYEPGEYEITALYPSGQSDPEIVLTFQKEPLFGMVINIVILVAIGFIWMGGVIFLVKHRQKI